MTNLMLQNLPDDLYTWLKQRAEANHRSLHQEAIALLQTLQKSATNEPPKKPTVEEMMSMARQFAELPELDWRDANEILGYNEYGLPG